MYQDANWATTDSVVVVTGTVVGGAVTGTVVGGAVTGGGVVGTVVGGTVVVVDRLAVVIGA